MAEAEQEQKRKDGKERRRGREANLRTSRNKFGGDSFKHHKTFMQKPPKSNIWWDRNQIERTSRIAT